MSGQDKASRSGDAGTGDARPGLTNRTLPSIDVEAFRRHYRESLQGKRGIVRLGPDGAEIPEHTPAHPLPAPSEKVPAQTPPVKQTASSDTTLDGQPPPSRTPPPAREPAPRGQHLSDDLKQLVSLLRAEVAPNRPVLYLEEGLGDPFEGMLNMTLKLKVPAALRDDQAPDAAKTRIEAESTPRDALDRPRFPNSFSLTEEELIQALLPLYPGVQPRDDQSVPLLQVTRLEAQLVEALEEVGQALLQLRDATRDARNELLKSLAAPLGLFADADIQKSVELLRSNGHEERFWTDDDSRRLKGVRLVGAYVLRKKGEALTQFRRTRRVDAPVLLRLLESVDRCGLLVNERRLTIARAFPEQNSSFATNFLVQRGLNARPGFFWGETFRELDP